MDEFYLNDSKRTFYSDALAHIRNCDHENWDLDEGLDKYIDAINLNPNIRTMSSKRGRILGYGQHSYLVICYSREAESRLQKDVEPALRLALNKNIFELTVTNEQPKIAPASSNAQQFLKYFDDPQYFNVHRIRYELKGGGNEDHDLFWNTLTELLSRV